MWRKTHAGKLGRKQKQTATTKQSFSFSVFTTALFSRMHKSRLTFLFFFLFTENVVTIMQSTSPQYLQFPVNTLLTENMSQLSNRLHHSIFNFQWILYLTIGQNGYKTPTMQMAKCTINTHIFKVHVRLLLSKASGQAKGLTFESRLHLEDLTDFFLRITSSLFFS